MSEMSELSESKENETLICQHNILIHPFKKWLLHQQSPTPGENGENLLTH